MKLPAVGTQRGFANAGGLFSFGPIVSDMRIVAKMDQILKGANPGDLPVEMPTDVDLVFNLVTADAIGVKISKALQFRANDNIRPSPG
jgi:putative tryptophan/tyrosine transport system substrate-binding protein